MAVYAFGDSHAHYIFARCPDVTTFWLGPRTMHRVGRDGAHFIPHLADPGPEDAIVLVFGEIDVRCHVARTARLRGVPIPHAIGELVDRYVVSVRASVEHFGIRAPVYMLGAPPPMDPIVPNARLPVHGPLDERIAIRRMLNMVLEGHARAYGMGFIPVPAHYEEADGSLRMRLSDGHAHIAIDHAHHVCRAVGERIGRTLRVRRANPVERLQLAVRRSAAFALRDDEALWDLGQMRYGRRRSRTGDADRPALTTAGLGAG